MQIQKSGEEFISEKQQEQEEIQKLSSSDQQSKVRIVRYRLMIVFLLHFQAHCACEICAQGSRSLMEFVQAEV